jgi:hypothetical protein
VPNAAKIKNASVPVGFVGVVVHHGRWKTPISLQLNFRQNAVANDRLLLGGPRCVFKAHRCDERRDNSYQAPFRFVASSDYHFAAAPEVGDRIHNATAPLIVHARSLDTTDMTICFFASRQVFIGQALNVLRALHQLSSA